MDATQRPGGKRGGKAALRSGFTTGSAAAAATKAAIGFLLHDETPKRIDIPLPTQGRLTIPVHAIAAEGGGARAVVVKDGGDDPDATHGHEIHAIVRLVAHHISLNIHLEGGSGVGRATLPGLPIAVGQAAINPAPRAQIMAAAREAAKDFCGDIDIIIEVPQGEVIAAKTLNPRLGITGGISILGTQGIVKPYSHEAYRASISEALDVARAAGLRKAVFTTGRRTERLYLESRPETPPLAMIQAADFFAHSCRAAAERGFTSITWAVFFGKLAKQAQGLEYTHARTHPLDFDLLAERCARAGAAPELLPAIRSANTARQVLAMLGAPEVRERLMASLKDIACGHARAFAARDIQTSCMVFDFDD